VFFNRIDPKRTSTRTNLAARNLTLELRIQPVSSTAKVHRISNRHTSPDCGVGDQRDFPIE
jgi:hypothetical protein